MTKQVPVLGVYCTKHVGDTQIMHCRVCLVLWSPCCGETHKCPEEQTVTVPPEPNSLEGWAGWET